MPSQYFSGWRSGLARCTAVAAAVTAVNVVFLVVAIPRLDTSGYSGMEGAMFSGGCNEAKQISIWLHLAINILATALLGAGNYMQQVLTAPTRHEIDLAHGKREYLDIGVSSFHNLSRISRKRVVAWVVLAFSSLPIHLLYNSVVSFETGVSRYTVYAARWKDLNDPDFEFETELYQALKTSLNEYERLENEECITNYARKLMSDRGEVILILDPSIPDNKTGDIHIWGGDPLSSSGTAYDWICDGSTQEVTTCDVSSVDPENWKVNAGAVHVEGEERYMRVDYCLSKPVSEHCRLILSIPLLAIVVGCNVLKLVGLALTWLSLDKKPLLILGDALASFLEDPDPATEGQCLLSKPSRQPVSWEAGPRVWLPKKHRWATSVSPRRYGVTVFFCISKVIAASVLLQMGISHILAETEVTPSLADLWNRGFGEVRVDSLIFFGAFDGPIRMVLMSNLPQLILSLLYAAINGMWTAMLVGVEWNSYGMKRKGLRTTYPVGLQRKTYWLSLPLSIFFVRLVAHEDTLWTSLPETSAPKVITTCGYSPIAIIFSIVLGSLILLITIGASLRMMKPAVPTGGTCSAVLSAACHQPESDENAASELVKWGVIAGRDGESLDHACLTSWSVEVPKAGRWYQ
ncbi:hypothetical protein B0T10DRAFT_412983 [Thelonectria olida]|uniref:DUF6536 domain-containing protein n=1 Tax=Thelonectria olida TaxID=1576542 RepID=A0A9P8VVF5_9HYPO|nr:hypothetical protein B0T10DRAFT_412983 [Thelonectria olida]